MDETLKARRQKAEDSFNELTKQKQEKQSEMDNIDAEMARLQGEWRLLNELLDKPKPKSKAKAEVLDVTNVEGA